MNELRALSEFRTGLVFQPLSASWRIESWMSLLLFPSHRVHKHPEPLHDNTKCRLLGRYIHGY